MELVLGVLAPSVEEQAFVSRREKYNIVSIAHWGFKECFYFQTGFYYVARAGLNCLWREVGRQLQAVCPLPSRCWDHRSGPQCLRGFPFSSPFETGSPVAEAGLCPAALIPSVPVPSLLLPLFPSLFIQEIIRQLFRFSGCLL